MKNLIVENKGNQIILKLNKRGFEDEYLISLVKRIQMEELAQKSGYDPEIFSLAETINQEWWDRNGEEFLKDVKR
jgi:hypothetical protein